MCCQASANTVTSTGYKHRGVFIVKRLFPSAGLLQQEPSSNSLTRDPIRPKITASKGIAQGSVCGVLISFIFLQGCSSTSFQGSNRSGSISSFIAPDNENLSIEETTEEQARREVLSAPTNFIVLLEDDKEAWERATFFLENYLHPELLKDTKSARGGALITSVVGSRWTLANPATSGSYGYQVSKQPMSKNGYRYLVVCQPRAGGNKYQASLNAANLARFIKDGKLEVSLLREIPQKQ